MKDWSFPSSLSWWSCGPFAVASLTSIRLVHAGVSSGTKYGKKKKKAKMTWDNTSSGMLLARKKIAPKSGLIALDLFFFL